ncbi:putative permease [Planctomycetes bacterium CA13]|uniref:Putative permease n=1 Tax=Novipirellula herctigrandis TaxID=2527986 RepID=A0A5C5Z098_9BACT|nr:putative permease [Planctomycetes bacterium CA13]
MVFWMIAKMFLAASPYIVLGFLMAGALHQWVPPDLLRRHLGRRGGLPLLKAVGIGSLLPICSCGTIPLGVGLYRCGAAAGTILSFMTSSPVLSPVVVLLSIKLLGWKMACTLLGTALLGSFLIGWVGNHILPDENSNDIDETKQYEPEPVARGGNSILQWLRWTFCDLGSHVGVELVIGLGVATLVMAFLPLEFISTWLGGQHITSLLLVILLSLPVYSCSVPSVPIVQSLLLLGLSPGAAVVYMMAGPATNMGELNAIRANMGGKVAGYYAIALIAVALTAGIATDRLIFSGYQYDATTINGELVVRQCCVPVLYNETSIYAIDFSDVTALQWGSAVVLFAVVAYGLYDKINEFLINPCRSCLWRDYAEKNRCAQKCHVRRKHDFYKKLKNRCRCKRD